MTVELTRPVPTADLELFVRPCGDCRASIMWTKTEASGGHEWLPIDAEPNEHGNVLAFPDPANPRRCLSRVIGDRGARRRLVVGGWHLRMPHQVSCAHAERWARGPKSMRPTPKGFVPAPAEDTAAAEPEGLW